MKVPGEECVNPSRNVQAKDVGENTGFSAVKTRREFLGNSNPTSDPCLGSVGVRQ